MLRSGRTLGSGDLACGIHRQTALNTKSESQPFMQLFVHGSTVGHGAPYPHNRDAET
jgi:hypothetical protein